MEGQTIERPRDDETSDRQNQHRALRLLSLDGGGIRGISELIILDEIMHRVKRTQKLDTTPLPADYFDLVCGTSTGGLIAILLGRLRLSVPEAIDKYRLLAKEVFSDRKSPGKDGTFKASKLEKAIKDAIESKLGPGTAQEKMFERENYDHSCKTFVCAVASQHINKQPRLFRTWSAHKNPGYNCAIWEACRATSAAPTFFKPIQIGEPGLEENFVDAGLGCNNPVKQLLQEATQEFGEREVSCIVSIGTGKPKVTGFKKSGFGLQRVLPTDLIKALASMATDTEAEATEMKERYRNCPGLYCRLNVDRGLESISLEEWEKLGEVKTHTMAYLQDRDVSQKVDEIAKALIGMPTRTYSLGHLGGAVPTVSQSTRYYMYPSYKVDHFVTREGPLKEIQQHHQYSERVVKAKVVVLFGIGGCGKSQMALEYCHQAEADRRFTAIFWVDASSPNTVAQSYTTIAATISKANIDTTDTAANIQLVIDMMSTWTTAWLLVFDNFDNPKVFTEKPVVDYFPRGKNGFILLTSRHAESERLGHTIAISNMLETEALELLFRSSKCERHDRNIAEGKKIIDRLGNLALAVDQAGAYIKGRIEFAAFLDHFNHRREDVLKTTPDIWAYRRKRNETEAEQSLSVATTWELSFDQIAGDPKDPTELESKRHLLTLSAFFNGQNIAEEIFQLSQNSDTLPWMTIFIRDGVWDKYRFLDVITELRNLSLIQDHINGLSGVSFSLHPLIQDWIKLRLDSQDQQKYTTEALRIFSSYIGTQNTDKLAVQAKQIILSHLDTGLENSHKYLHGAIRLGESTLEAPALIFANFYLEQGRYGEAERLYGRALKGREERLGQDHPDTLRIVGGLAIVYSSQGRYEEAERLYGRALKGYEERLGRDHPDTLRTVHNLANIYEGQGQYEEAERLYGRALKGREERLGRDHPDTLRTVGGLANVYGGQGRYEEAERLYGRALKGHEERLGRDHPDTLKTVHNLARVQRLMKPPPPPTNL